MNPADLTWDPAAEQSVLGSILLSPACLPTVERSLRPADFRLASDRAVYEAVLSLERAGGSVDPVTVFDQTAKMGAPVSREYLFGLMELAATAAILICLVRLVQRIVEQKDGTESELAVNEINTGTYCFHVADLVDALHKIDNHNAQQEYYLTDVFGIMIRENKQVIPVVAEDADETMGVNSRRQLATANKDLYLRKAEELMDQGITIVSPENTYIGQDVMVGHDTTILPGTILSGNTRVGEDCVIGPDTQLDNVTCGNGNTLNRVYAHDCTIGNNNTMGPFVHLRPDTDIHNHVKIGNFVEVKNSVVDDGTKLPHLIYCGDADLGKKVNFGCGTVTVNFDGKNKHRTVVEDHAFIGCNTNLVAPVHVGKNAFTAAGSTITEDVPDNALAIARQRQTNKINWVTKDTYKD